MTSLIVAYSDNRVIGRDNDLPWHIPEDLKRFKELTTGNTVIMGRKTFESIFKRLGKPLPNRRNIVVSTSLKSVKGVEIASSLPAALALARNDGEVFILGGEQLYRDALKQNLVDRIYATQVHARVDGDAYFPKLDERPWRVTSREVSNDACYKYSFVIMERSK